MGSYKKKLFIVLLLFLLISFFVCSSSFATMQDIQYSVDQPTLLKEQQEYLASIFLRKLISQKPNTDNLLNNFTDYAKSPNYFPFLTYNVSSDNAYITCYMIPIGLEYNDLDSYEINTDDSYFEDDYFVYPVSGYNLSASNWRRYRYRVDNQVSSYESFNGQVFLPSALIMYQNQTIKNFINGVNPSDSSIAMIINAIQENTEEQEEQTEEMKKLNNFMSSEDVDDDAYDMPTDNPTQDITEAGINGIFTMFYDKINNWESENITIRIPFANKIFIIPSDLTENIVNSYIPNTTTFGRLFGLIWYYLLGVYIVKDIQKYIDGLQTGEILTKSDTNIKTEML